MLVRTESAESVDSSANTADISAAAAFLVRSSAFGHRWLYVLSVIVGAEWPSACWTVTTSQPSEARTLFAEEGVQGVGGLGDGRRQRSGGMVERGCVGASTSDE